MTREELKDVIVTLRRVVTHEVDCFDVGGNDDGAAVVPASKAVSQCSSK